MQRGGCWCKSWKKMPGLSRDSRRKASDRRELENVKDLQADAQDAWAADYWED